jgi:hypothetical protein
VGVGVLVGEGVIVFVGAGVRVAVAVPIGLGSAVAVKVSTGICKVADAVSLGCAGLHAPRKSNNSIKLIT